MSAVHNAGYQHQIFLINVVSITNIPSSIMKQVFFAPNWLIFLTALKEKWRQFFFSHSNGTILVKRPFSRTTCVSFNQFWMLLELRTTEVVLPTGAIRRAKLVNCYHQQTNTQLFIGQTSFLLPNQQCQSSEGKCITFHELSPTSSGGVPTLSLTIKGSWLPWQRVARPHVIPLTLLPHGIHIYFTNELLQNT